MALAERGKQGSRAAVLRVEGRPRTQHRRQEQRRAQTRLAQNGQHVVLGHAVDHIILVSRRRLSKAVLAAKRQIERAAVVDQQVHGVERAAQRMLPNDHLDPKRVVSADKIAAPFAFAMARLQPGRLGLKGAKIAQAGDVAAAKDAVVRAAPDGRQRRRRQRRRVRQPVAKNKHEKKKHAGHCAKHLHPLACNNTRHVANKNK